MRTDELLELLAKHLEDTRDRLVERWLAEVRNDPELPSARPLEDAALTDHLADLSADLGLWLRTHAGADAQARAHSHGAQHGEKRWSQGFPLEELLREQWILYRVLAADAFAEFLTTHDLPEAEFLATRSLALRCLQAHGAGSTGRFVEHWGERLRAANAQLAEVDASRLSLLRAVTHELANVLQALTLGLGAVGQGTLDPERRRMLAFCTRSLADMDSLVEELRQYGVLLAWKGAPELETVSLAAFADGLDAAHRLLAEARGVEFTVRIKPGLDTVVTDPRRLRQIATNLVTNAVKYRDAAKARAFIEVVLGPSAEGRWVLSVRDNGIGIAADDLERIFDEFQRVTPRGEIHGTGLGLAIGRRLAALLGGDVRATSQLGEGSRFEVDLPIRPQT